MNERPPLVQPVSLAATLAAVRAGRATLREVVAAACDRIDAVEPIVHALLPERGRRARLLAEADALSARFPEADGRPPLCGALLGVKDIFHVDGFVTRAGTTVPPGRFAGPESAAVAALRSAGALVLGKTVTTEFAFYEPGPTRNPHDPERTPGGSSSGAAAAVAAGICHVALGTQTVGSVIRPAAYCGVVGFKPTAGRISTAGVVPFSATADQVGLFAADVAGLVPVAAVVCAAWRPPGTPGAPGTPAAAAAPGAPGGRRPVLGVPVGPYLDQAPPATLAAFEAQVARLAGAGYEVRRAPVLADIAGINRRHRDLIAAEMAEAHAPWFDAYAGRYRPRTAALVREGRAVPAAVLAEARASAPALRAELERCMAESGVDVWLSPAAPGPAPIGLASTGDPVMNLPWTHAGLPTLTLPAGRLDGLPVGLQCAARAMADEPLVAWAAGLEAALAR